MDPWGEKGRCFPLGVVPEASPEIFEGPTSFPIVDLGGARLISWAPARVQELCLGGNTSPFPPKGPSPTSDQRPTTTEHPDRSGKA